LGFPGLPRRFAPRNDGFFVLMHGTTMDDKHKTYPIPTAFAAKAHINAEQYQTLYQRSINNPDEFWSEQAQHIDWFKPWQTVKSGGFEKLDIRWFVDGKLNACYNCVDRHLATRADKTAIIWEGDDPEQSLNLTYAQLHEKICRLANALKQLGVKKGDRVCIYLPMIPEAVITNTLHFIAGNFAQNTPHDFSRSCYQHAGLCPHRRCALSGVWRLLARIVKDTHFRCRLSCCDYCG
jgi:hypothetical protein